PPIIADFRRRDRLLDERQIRNSGLDRQCDALFFSEDLERRDIFAEWESGPIHNDKVRQFEQSPIFSPALHLLVHIGSYDAQKLGVRKRFLHRFERFHRIALFESIYFYSRRSKLFNGNGRQRHHRKAVKRRGQSRGRFVWRSKRRHEMKFINLEGFRDRLSCGEMSVMDGIESPAQYRNPHVPALILTQCLATLGRGSSTGTTPPLSRYPS